MIVSYPGGAVQFTDPPQWTRPDGPLTARIAYAAAHVAPLPWAENAPDAPAAIDWDATLAFRRHLWSWGLGVAEAMDTAQRGMGLDWPATQELITRSAAEARACGGAIVAGAGTDHAGPLRSLAEVTAAYAEQLEFVEGTGAVPALMASRQLAALASSPDEYAEVYADVLAQASAPVVLHWLGEAFDPALAGYWGSGELDKAADSLLEIIAANSAKVDGVKVSVLDAEREIAVRRRLPPGIRLYTGDDFHYDELIRGDGVHASDALLGAFAAIAPAASGALQALGRGDLAGYDAAMGPTMELSRHLFAAPTRYYKTGIAFLAWLAGHQPGFTMVGGLQSGRSLPHLVRAAGLAAKAGVLGDPDLAGHRLRSLLSVGGVS
ncbi:MAG: hypothetical protein QOD41_2802 [Cryptosporangiaceae bacterium]|nr:hypothetical protein [Cryptosporangiaceae bacterium]